MLPAGRAPLEALEIPLPGTPDAGVRIRFGAGNLQVGAAAAGHLVDGRFEGGVIHRLTGPGRVELEQDTRYGLPWLERDSRWTVGLTNEVPLDLKINAGASRTILDLRDLRVRSLDLQTGASETRVCRPAGGGGDHDHGADRRRVADLRDPGRSGGQHPDQDGAREHPGRSEPASRRAALGYESPDYATAANRVEIDVQGGVGSLRVVGGT